MHEIPPEDEKPKKHWFSSSARPAPKPDPMPKPKSKPVERRTPERERRQVRLAQNLRPRSPKDNDEKNPYRGCGCVLLALIVGAILVSFFM